MYLTKNDAGTYYYRRPILAEDQSFWVGARGNPKREWSRSLGTKDRRTAIGQMRYAESAYDDERTEQLARHLMAVSQIKAEPTSREREEQAALDLLEAERNARFDARQGARIRVRRRMALATMELSEDEAAARDLIREWKAEAEAAQRDRDRLMEHRLADLDVPGSRPAMPAPLKGDARTVKALCEAYKAANWGKWGASSRKAIVPVLRVLADVVGDRAVLSIDRETARTVFEAVQALPVNMGRRIEFRGLTVPEAIAKAQKIGAATLNPNTINRAYMVQIAAVFNWAVKEEWAIRNPFKGLSVADAVDDRDRRDPFTTQQLKDLFAAEPWHQRQPDDAARPGRYWVPLIALYSGMRLGEIAGLRIMDIEDMDGITAMKVRPYEGRGLKTKESRRDIPVHSALTGLGLASFVAYRRCNAKPDELLFPDGKANSRGQSGAKLGEWFSGLLKTRKITGVKLGMHSFRHNFEDRLKAVGLHGSAEGQALGGRTVTGTRKIVGSEKLYGSAGLPLALLQEALERVSYPGLELNAAA